MSLGEHALYSRGRDARVMTAAVCIRCTGRAKGSQHGAACSLERLNQIHSRLRCAQELASVLGDDDVLFEADPGHDRLQGENHPRLDDLRRTMAITYIVRAEQHPAVVRASPELVP